MFFFFFLQLSRVWRGAVLGGAQNLARRKKATFSANGGPVPGGLALGVLDPRVQHWGVQSREGPHREVQHRGVHLALGEPAPRGAKQEE